MELNTLVTEPDYSLLNSEISLPELPQEKPAVRPKDAYEDAFYAVNPGSSNPIDETAKAAEDMLMQGQSAIVDAAKNKWLQEQDVLNKKVIGDLLQDESVDKTTKINALTQYAAGNYVSSDLKDKYIQKVAATDPGSHKDDVQAQDKNIDALPSKLMLSINKKQDRVLEKFSDEIHDNVITKATQVNFKDVTSVNTHSFNSLDLLKDTILDGVRFALEGNAKRDAEFTAFQNLIYQTPRFLESLALRTTGLFAQGVTGDIPSFKESAKLTEQLQKEGAPGNWLSSMGDKFIAWQVKKAGIEKEYEESVINKGFTKLGQKIEKTGELLEKKTEGAVTKEAFQYGADVFMLFAPHMLGKSYKVIKKAYQDRQPREGEVLPPEDQGPAGPGLESRPGEPIEGEYTTVYDPITEDVIRIGRTQESARVERSASTAVTINPETNEVVPTQQTLDLGIEPNSALDVTNQANPIVGADVATMALTDQTGQVADTLGTSQASIFFSSILPSLERRYGDLRNNPDLRSRLRALEQDLQGQIDYGMFDPNALDIYQYYSDKLAIDRIINEQNLPYLRLNDSLVNQTNLKLTGSFLFGRNEHFYFNTKEQVEAAYNNIINTIEVPANAKSSIKVLDRKTGETFTFSDFMKTKAYDVAGYEPPQPGYTTLYRGEYTGPLRNAPSWVREINQASGQSRAAGRWWTPDVNVAQWYANDAGRHGKIVYINVPNSFLESYKVANSNPIVQRFSRDPEKELFLPQEYIGKGKLFERAPSEAHEFAIQWDFSKQYDALASFVDGLEQHKVELHKWAGGLDVTKLANKKFFSENIFWTQKFPAFVQKQFAREAERAAFISSKAVAEAQNIVSRSKHGKELNKLIIYGNDNGLDLIPITRIQQLFPDLNLKARQELFEDLAAYRILDNHFYNMTNIMERYDLTERGFTSSLYRGKKYIGAVQTRFQLERPDGKLPTYVYDLDTKTVVPFNKGNLDLEKFNGYFDIEGRQLVQLEKPIEVVTPYQSFEMGPDGEQVLGPIKRVTQMHTLALVGTKVKVRSSLPREVLPKIPGHAPILNKGHFIVMIEPKELVIDGRPIPDDKFNQATRVQYRKAVGIAQTRKELKALKLELEDRYPDYKVLEREAVASLKDYKDALSLHKENLARAKMRGQPLVGLHGVRPPIEEPLLASVESYKHAVKSFAKKDIDYALEKQFMKEYGHLVPKGEFPQKVEDIASNPNFSKEELLQYQKAVNLFNYKQSMELLGNWDGLDSFYQTVLHGISDILETANVPAGILRESGNKGIAPARALRHLTSTVMIALNPPKQWFIQTTQGIPEALAYRGIGLDAKAAAEQLSVASAVILALGEDSWLSFGNKVPFSKAAYKSVSWALTEQEFNTIVEDFKTLVPAANLNLLVKDVFSDHTAKLDPGTVENITSKVSKVATGIPTIGRRIGFSSAEIWNRLNLYLFAIKNFKKTNPGDNWMLPATRENLMFESWRLSQGMSQSGSLKWQTEGAASFILQFFANNFKATMSFLVKDSTMLTPGQTARLFGTKFALWGTYAVAGLTLLTGSLINNMDDPEARKSWTAISRGIYNQIMNSTFRWATNSKMSDIDFASQLSSTDLHLIDVAKNIYYAFDQDRSTEPRFPLSGGVGVVYDTFKALNNFYSVKQFATDAQKVEAYKRLTLDLLSVIKGFDNASKAVVAWSLGDLEDSKGNKYGLNLSHADALGQFFGMPNANQHKVVEQLMSQSDRSKAIKDLAKNWHEYFIKEFRNTDPNDLNANLQKADLYSTFKSAMVDSGKWTTAEMDQFDKEFQKLDNYSQKTLQNSIFKFFYDNENQKQTEEFTNALKYMEDWLVSPQNNLSKEDTQSIKDTIDLHKGKQ